MTQYKLHYFDMGGKGEFIRQIFAVGGKEFEDNRIKMSEWSSIKASKIVKKLQLPALEVDGKMLAQSLAIGRYLGKQFDLAGKNAWDAAKVDMYADGIADVITQIGLLIGAILGFNKEDKNELLTKLKSQVLQPFMTTYEKFLAENGGDYFVGNEVHINLTWADIIIADFLDKLNQFNGHILDEHSQLKAFLGRIHNLPKLKKYLESRPKSPW